MDRKNKKEDKGDRDTWHRHVWQKKLSVPHDGHHLPEGYHDHCIKDGPATPLCQYANALINDLHGRRDSRYVSCACFSPSPTNSQLLPVYRPFD